MKTKTVKTVGSKSKKKTVKEVKYIPKHEMLEDARENVRNTRDHILFVLDQKVRDVLVDLLVDPASASRSAKTLFPKIRTALLDHASAMFPGSPRDSLMDIVEYLEKHANKTVADIVTEGLGKVGYMDYACGLVLLRIALQNFGRGAGCVTRCDLVAHFSPTLRNTLISHYDKNDPASAELFDECVKFFHDVLHKLDIEDLREFHNMVFLATGGYCSILPFDKLLLESNM